jgi:hypothetical protein
MGRPSREGSIRHVGEHPTANLDRAWEQRRRRHKEAKRRFTCEQMDRWLQDRGVTLIGADLDESPMAYRRLPEVIAQHAGTVKGAAHPAAVCSGDGGDARARSLEGLVNGNPAPIAATVSLGQRLHRVRVIMDQLETPDKDLPLRDDIPPMGSHRRTREA